jgi:cytidylate kinase
MPLITISRMYGSGGSEIAERVATELGWTLFDNDVIDRVAERLGMPRAEVEAREEKPPSIVDRIASALSLGTPESMPAVADDSAPSTEDEIVAVTRRVIEEAVQAGPAVFVGRGAQCLLASRDDALHVFCYAPTAALVRYAVETLGVPEREAEKKVHDVNRQREQYVRRHWQRRWGATENYHLCVDTGWLGIPGAASLIVDVARRRLIAGAAAPGQSDRSSGRR